MAETITNPPFTGVHNFRDVGKVINSFKVIQLKEGLLFRSGRLDDATTADTKLLADGYHLKTVIDLRNKSEHLKQKEVLRNQSTSIHSGQVVGKTAYKSWDTVKINFTGRKFEINLVRQLKWWQVMWVYAFCYVEGTDDFVDGLLSSCLHSIVWRRYASSQRTSSVPEDWSG